MIAFKNILPIFNKYPYKRTIFSDLKNMDMIEHWMPCEDIANEYQDKKYSVVVLNTPINFSFNTNFVVNLWNNAKVRVTVDGGTKRWLKWLSMNKRELDFVAEPELITGDMDSLPDDILNYFKKSCTEIVVTPDQDETDYVKALRELKKYYQKKDIEIDTVYVLADTCGRFDQIMANINALYKCKDILGNIKVFQIASDSLTWLLEKGHHTISIPKVLRDNKEWCSLIPIGSPCIVTTSGLKWNMENWKLEFGGLVSSSNTYNGSSEVTIKTDNRVIWSMSLDTLL